MSLHRAIRAFTLMVVLCAAAGCGDDADEHASQPCDKPEQCYSGIDQATLRGAVQCLDRVPGGYCTHLCDSDGDCCAVSGECKSDHKQVCAPFESTSAGKMCFLSCEDSDVKNGDPDGYCHEFAGSSFSCRSTGGGSQNRKVCVP